MSAYFEKFNPFVDYVPEWPFKRLSAMAWRASQILSHYPIEEIRRIAALLDEAIAAEKNAYVDSETEAYIERLVRNGGWELEYLSGGPEGATEGNIRWLLAHWPTAAERSPDLPDADDLWDSDALEAALDYDHFQDPFLTPGEEWYSMLSTPQLWAVFVLMKIEDALQWLGWVKGNRWLSSHSEGLSKERMSIAGDCALEAAAGIAELERVNQVRLNDIGSRLRDSHKATGSVPELLKEQEGLQRARPVSREAFWRQRAANGGAGKAQRYEAIRNRVRELWLVSRKRFGWSPSDVNGGEKSDLLRFHNEIVLPAIGGEFKRLAPGKKTQRGDPMKISFETTREYIKDLLAG